MENNTYGIIYCALNTINNKRYIGQTIRDLNKRKMFLSGQQLMLRIVKKNWMKRNHIGLSFMIVFIKVVTICR